MVLKLFKLLFVNSIGTGSSMSLSVILQDKRTVIQTTIFGTFWFGCGLDRKVRGQGFSARRRMGKGCDL